MGRRLWRLLSATTPWRNSVPFSRSSLQVRRATRLMDERGTVCSACNKFVVKYSEKLFCTQDNSSPTSLSSSQNPPIEPYERKQCCTVSELTPFARTVRFGCLLLGNRVYRMFAECHRTSFTDASPPSPAPPPC